MQATLPQASSTALDDSPVTFGELGVPGPLVHVLKADGKTTAFPIQRDTLPDSLAGRDVLGRGRTGSGKTLAFSIPLVSRLSEVDYALGSGYSDADFRKAVKKTRRRHQQEHREQGFVPHPRGLVLAPTRELANQISEVLAPLAAAYGIDTTTVYGGVRYQRQISDLRAGADIVVACPGRLEDLINQGALTLCDVQVVVIDEADEMADMGFLPPIKRILGQIQPNAQHMLFSATLDHGVDEVVNEFLHDPIVHSVDDANAQVDSMTHHVFVISRNDKPALVKALASGKSRRILFTRTKFQAKKLAKSLTQQGIPAAELHGNLSQNQRDRNLAAFEQGDVNVLVATDVAARGIDVSGVDVVIQVDPPEDPKAFLHRSGRTARAGRKGDVVTIMTPDQRRYVRTLLHKANINAKPHKVALDDAEVLEMIGEVAEPVFGWDLDKTQPVRPARNQRNHTHKRNPNRSGRKDRGPKKNVQESAEARQQRQAEQQRMKKDRRRKRAAERLLAQGKELEGSLKQFHAEHLRDWTQETTESGKKSNAHSRKRRNAQQGHVATRKQGAQSSEQNQHKNHKHDAGQHVPNNHGNKNHGKSGTRKQNTRVTQTNGAHGNAHKHNAHAKNGKQNPFSSASRKQQNQKHKRH
ncbi:DEAD/DEAH box helicase [Bifidobacterium dolichotidis]|uniref:DEAD/DEAH box helicase n=1 Tax=Bifidobacterium dolichotidis TaxID=2306976 RepID=A0A430FSJ8_9BIFI|nr:DEAD/DEAH box helicase [Bifidobacterium dolichotidis]RSX55831.1 DEAD/DEAH box helicase [Bifidobacterium dolichotidis]